MNKYKKGDNVLIISGRDKGKEGIILSVDPTNSAIVVENINIIKKHTKKTEQNEGGVVESPAAFNWSKAKVICKAKKKPTRIGFKVTKTKKVRVAKATGETI